MCQLHAGIRELIATKAATGFEFGNLLSQDELRPIGS
jgi:hypothetical protein